MHNPFSTGGLDELQKFVQAPPKQQDCEFEYYNSDPIPDFVERLPDKIINPETGKEVTISQSLIKQVRKLAMGELCPKQFYHVSLNRDIEIDKKVMAMGSRFEYELTGAHDLDGSIPDEVLTSSGKVGADQNRISDNAANGKETLRRVGVNLDNSTVQAQVNFKCLSSNMDLCEILTAYEVGKEPREIWNITDIKYSALIGSNWSEYSWTEDNIRVQFDLKCQALQYTLLAVLSGADSVSFQYIVFDSRPGHEGEYQVFKIEVSESALNQHKHVILKTIEQLQRRFDGEGFNAIPSYEKCKDCPVIHCADRERYPEVKVVEI